MPQKFEAYWYIVKTTGLQFN